MNKKQLSLQNESLFAELERKAKEIEILNIRLEDSDKKISSLTDEKKQLSDGLSAANAEIATLKSQIENRSTELNEQIEALKNELERAKTEASVTNIHAKSESTIYNMYNDDSDSQQVIANDTKAFENVTEQSDGIIEATIAETNTDSKTSSPINVEENSNFEEPVEVFEAEAEPIYNDTPSAEPERAEDIADEQDVAAPTTEKYVIKSGTRTDASIPTDSTPITDLLRDYGAKVIGKVTRVTAEVISKINVVDEDAAASLKTLALGKNESFKFKVMELAKMKSDPDRIMAEMDFLADEAIIYLRSI